MGDLGEMDTPSQGTPEPALPPPGWYNDPKMADTRRYWNGSAWTDHIAPGGTPARHVRPEPERRTIFGPVLGAILAAVVIIGGIAAFANEQQKQAEEREEINNLFCDEYGICD
jgi:hypothetical protein